MVLTRKARGVGEGIELSQSLLHQGNGSDGKTRNIENDVARVSQSLLHQGNGSDDSVALELGTATLNGVSQSLLHQGNGSDSTEMLDNFLVMLSQSLLHQGNGSDVRMFGRKCYHRLSQSLLHQGNGSDISRRCFSDKYHSVAIPSTSGQWF